MNVTLHALAAGTWRLLARAGKQGWPDAAPGRSGPSPGVSP
ncbi:MAG: hypothetical protein ACXWC2_03985 [Ramlibacter sp.]